MMVFGPSSSFTSHPTDLGPLIPPLESTVSNLGLKLYSDFNWTGKLVLLLFVHLRQLDQVKPLLSQQYFERVINAFA